MHCNIVGLGTVCTVSISDLYMYVNPCSSNIMVYHCTYMNELLWSLAILEPHLVYIFHLLDLILFALPIIMISIPLEQFFSGCYPSYDGN